MSIAGDDVTESEQATPWPAFADLLAATSLLFLVLFAVIAVPALRAADGAKARASKLAQVDSILQRVAAQNRVRATEAGDYELVTIEGDATFPARQYQLKEMRAEGKTILRSFGAALNSQPLIDLIYEVQVVGHASREGSEMENWQLSAQRAATIAQFLIDSVGLSACSVSALGRSHYYPVDTSATQSLTVDPRDRRIELEFRPVLPRDQNQVFQRSRCRSGNRGARGK